MKLAFAFLLLSFSVIADYKSEQNAINAFRKDHFFKKENWVPGKNGDPPTLIVSSFRNELNSNEKSLRYYFISLVTFRIPFLYKRDKAFAIYLENKFKGKKLTDDDLSRVNEAAANFILKDSIPVLKDALKFPAPNEAYFKRVLAQLDKLTF